MLASDGCTQSNGVERDAGVECENGVVLAEDASLRGRRGALRLAGGKGPRGRDQSNVEEMGARPKIPALTTALSMWLLFAGKDAAVCAVLERTTMALQLTGCSFVAGDCCALLLYSHQQSRTLCRPKTETVTWHSCTATLKEASTSGHPKSIKLSSSPFRVAEDAPHNTTFTVSRLVQAWLH